MTISATTQGLRPGVCLSTAKPSNPFDGQVIYMTDVNQTAVWDGTSWTVLAPIAGNRNILINGDMRVNQRGYTSASPVSVSTGSQVYYSTDRWYGSGETSQGVYSLGQSTTVPSSETFINSLVVTCTTADASLAATDDYEFGQFIEGFNASSLGYGTSAAKQSVLSFWVRSSLIGTYCVALRNSASNRSYIAEYTINVADTWEKKTIYIIGDTTGTWLTNTSIGVSITWALAVGSTYQTAAGSWTAGNYLCSSNQVNWMSTSTSRTFYITGVQLEVGAVATPFEFENYGTTLAKCQRYFWAMAVLSSAPGAMVSGYGNYCYMMLSTLNPVPMRIAPVAGVNPSYPLATYPPYIADFNSNLRTVTAVDMSPPLMVRWTYDSTKLTTGLSLGLNYGDANRTLWLSSEL